MLADTSGLVALLDRSERHHRRCLAASERYREQFITTWPAFTESMLILQDRAGWSGARSLWTLWFRGHVRLTKQSAALARMQELMSKYADVPMAFADASLVALAEERRETRILSVDSDFHTYVATWGGSLHGFELIPGAG